MPIKIFHKSGHELFLYKGDSLSGANLMNANLSGANLSGANLMNANLMNANLSGANLRSAEFGGTESLINWPATKESRDLVLQIAKIVLAAPTKLQMAKWHSCETTHCLAGWAIHLSGQAARYLESSTSPSVAGAMLIPQAAHLFYESNDTVLDWLRKQAARETKPEEIPS